MRKVSGLLALAIIAFALSGCSAPGDEPAKKWTDFMDKHTQTVKDGSFDVDAYKSEGKPLAEELAKHKGDDGKVRMTQDVLDEFNRANKEFEAACDEKKDFAAILAFAELAKILEGKDESGDADEGNSTE